MDRVKMPPKQTKIDPVVKRQESPELFTIPPLLSTAPMVDSTAANTDTASGTSWALVSCEDIVRLGYLQVSGMPLSRAWKCVKETLGNRHRCAHPYTKGISILLGTRSSPAVELEHVFTNHQLSSSPQPLLPYPSHSLQISSSLSFPLGPRHRPTSLQASHAKKRKSS
jgi:hypothetical protein